MTIINERMTKATSKAKVTWNGQRSDSPNIYQRIVRLAGFVGTFSPILDRAGCLPRSVSLTNPNPATMITAESTPRPICAKGCSGLPDLKIEMATCIMTITNGAKN
jgi:hypothetical protein